MEVDEMETSMSELQESEERIGIQRKTESDDDSMSDSHSEYVPSTSESPNMKAQCEDGSDSLCVIKEAVVVLTQLPYYKISGLRPPTPPQFYSEDESLSSSESDSSDSDSPNNKWEAKTHAPQMNQNINVAEQALVVISLPFCDYSDEIPGIHRNEEEVKVDMTVLAKNKSKNWQRGKILDIIARDDGKLKYKVSFEDKGRSLVSGHHIAFDSSPTLEQLYVGARVVINCQENASLFRPGVLSELPCRRNRSRFLVFLDDHVPVYVSLPSFHLVCRPLENVLDDVPDCRHMSFMTKYLKDWPFTHLTQYSVGQNLCAELNGVQQRCEVQAIDSSLMEVVFQDNQQKEWIHRGSMRLEHMARFLDC